MTECAIWPVVFATGLFIILHSENVLINIFLMFLCAKSRTNWYLLNLFKYFLNSFLVQRFHHYKGTGLQDERPISLISLMSSMSLMVFKFLHSL